MKLDPAVLELLSLSPSKTTVSSAGGGGCSAASTYKITTTLDDGTKKQFFMKSGNGKDAEAMFKGTLEVFNARDHHLRLMLIEYR